MIDNENDNFKDIPRNLQAFHVDRNNDYEALNRDDNNMDRTGSFGNTIIYVEDRNSNITNNLPLIRIGLLIIVSPIIMTFVTSLYYGVSMLNEGTGTGVYLWLLILTIPCGISIITGAIVLRLIRYFRRARRFNI